MQVLVLAVQNAVDYAVLGAATSGVTLMRGVGGSLGHGGVRRDLHDRLGAELRRRCRAAARGRAERG